VFRLITRILGALAVLAGGFVATLYFLGDFEPKSSGNVDPRCAGGQRTTIAKPIPAELGFAFIVSLPALESVSDSNSAPSRSKLMLCENGSVLGPAHSLHDDIRNQGRGRYSHWAGHLLFSASDNSDPNKNQRTYFFVLQP